MHGPSESDRDANAAKTALFERAVKKLFVPYYGLIKGGSLPAMKVSRFIFAIVLSVAACTAISAAGGPPAEKSNNNATLAGGGARATQPILPRQFAGWQTTTIRKSTDPLIGDPVNAALLKEYGFTDFESAAYTRDDGRKLTIKAARFADASGAYGAFTYYKTPQMLTEKIGDQGASLNERVLFYRANILVDAVFDRLTAMSAAELRELAADLPIVGGASGNLPGLPGYLPQPGYVKNTAKYIVGPEGLAKVGAPLQSTLVDFDAGAEVVLGNYQTSGGEATLMLIAYPTPQIAAERLRRIEAARQANATSGGQAASNSFPQGPFFDKRTGPILVIATGPLSESEGKSLLGAVNYEADVTWNENTYFTRRDNLANLLMNIIILCGILIAFSAVAGLAFGGLRLVVKRFWPDKVFDRREEIEFISLHLSEGEVSAERNITSSIEKG